MSESNPYQSPRAKSRNAEKAPTQTPAQPPVKPPTWVRASGYLCLGLCLLGSVAYSFTAAMLIPQALRLEAELEGIPGNFQAPGAQAHRAELRDVVQISWVLGIVCIGLVVTLWVAAVLTLKQRYAAGWGLWLLSVVVYVVLAIALRPA